MHARAVGASDRRRARAAPPAHARLVGKLAVETEGGAFLGDVRIRLLEAIGRCGSISQAAGAVPLSYKAAWDAVDAMNNVADRPLVERAAGGRHGGGTTLTDYGRRLVAMYRAVEQEYQGALDRLAGRMGEAGAGDVRHFQGLLRSLSMRTSARNQFTGTVASLEAGPRGVEVRLRIGDGQQIRSLITRHSARGLELRVGAEVQVLVKAASVALKPDAGPDRNALRGTVERIDRGPAHAEVCLALEGGRRIISIVALERLAQLKLRIGGRCRAAVDASSVVLFRFD
jgi:molybdate transport system regulatory protein